MGEDVAVPRRVRRMPEDGGRRGGRRGGRVGGRAPSAQPWRGASSSRTHQAGPSQVSEIFSDDTVYRPEFDRSQGQVQVDQNEPASVSSQVFMAHAGTPPSAYMPDPYVMVSEPAPAPAPQDPTTAERGVDEGVAQRGRGRRAPRRRDSH
ncbi:hypothetical protein PIB30_049278 [Stylosanthes scabra]|uniref:Uncharacterized protein n=1 Tax=Stylosanthes scabra TaxID=79078 RepID=A0ABU6YJ26_9FABA|nr:hypothetical protein [Stylosanthes scabra]